MENNTFSLISTEYVKAVKAVPMDMDDGLVESSISYAEGKLKDVLGSKDYIELYETLLLNRDNPIDNLIPTYIRNLFTYYAKPAMIEMVKYDIIIPSTFNLTSKGIVKFTSDDYIGVETNELKLSRSFQETKMDESIQTMLDFVNDNKEAEEELITAPYSYGIYFDDEVRLEVEKEIRQ